MTEQELAKKRQRRKDVVKNIAIIFLTIMLLLTFFSNTIMNYSLAEVSAAYASSGALTTKIRGDGFVEAKDPKQVMTEKVSEVLKVYVKEGDKVKKGQTLFVLEGEVKKSDITKAQEELLTLNYDYQKALLEIAVPDYAKNNMEIKYAKKDLETALEDAREAKTKIAEKKKEYKKLKKKADDAKTVMLDEAEKVADMALKVAEQELKISELEAQVTDYDTEIAALGEVSTDNLADLELNISMAKRELEDAQAEQAKYKGEGDRTSAEINAEIKTKKKEIATLETELESLQIALADAQNTSNSASVDEITRNIGKTNTKIRNKNTEISNKNAQIVAKRQQINNTTDEELLTKYQQDLEQYLNELEILRNDLTQLQETLTDYQYDLAQAQKTQASENNKAIRDAQKNITAKNKEITTAKEELTELQTEKKESDSREALLATATTAVTAAEKKVKQAERALENAQSAAKKDNSTEIKKLKTEQKEVKEKLKDAKAAKTTLDNQKTKLDTSSSEAQEAYNTAKAEADAYQQADETTLDSLNQAAEEKRKALETLYVDLAATRKDDNLKKQLSALDSQQKQDTINSKKKEIIDLQKKTKNTLVKAEVAGVISSLNIRKGETTTPETAMAEIMVKKNGYQFSFQITNEQSKLVKKGDHAEVLNIWDEVKAVLAEIKTDPKNPSAGKTLVFNVSGAVENGTSISVSVGERTANYDCIVPTSAIREDSEGKFVLIIQEKPSPVGNRYVAKKEPVSIITQDETQSAVSASFDNYTSIITTASKSVEPGDYVRLAAS